MLSMAPMENRHRAGIVGRVVVGGGREREICATNIKLTLVRKLSIVW